MLKYFSFLKKLKGLDWKNLVYPATSGVFLLLVVGLSLLNLQFLSKNFTKAFATDETAVQKQLVRVQFDDLLVVAKKLGIELVPEQPAAPAEPATTSSDVGGEGVAAPPPPPEESVEQPQEEIREESVEELLEEDKTLLKIQVLNSTETKGLAASLKEKLSSAGFLIENTGNFSTIQELTQVKIKEEKATSFPVSVDELKQIVSGQYTLDEETQNLEPDSPYDITVIIGTTLAH